MAVIKVFVSLKAGILDPQGRAIRHALGSLGFDECQSVQTGKYFELDFPQLSEADALVKAEDIARKLLANPNIEVYRLAVKE